MGTVSGPASSQVGHVALWNNTTGTLLSDAFPTPDWINVLNYGADPTGSSDSTTAISNALAAVPSAGGVVYFPAGTYKASSISVTAANVALRGDGYTSSTLLCSSTTGNFITLSGGHGIIRDLLIESTSTRTSGDLIYVNCGGALITDFQIYSSTASFFNCIHCDATNAINFIIQNGLINGYTNAGIQIGDASSTSINVVGILANLDMGTTSGSNGVGILIYTCGGMDVTNVGVILGKAGVQTYPGSGQVIFGVYFTNVFCDTCSSDCWSIYTNGGTVGDLQLTACWGASSTGGNGITIGGATASAMNGICITGGEFINNHGMGINIAASYNVTLNGVSCYNNSQSGSGSYAGIGVNAGITEFQIVNSISGIGGKCQQQGFHAYQSYGILVASGASDKYIITSNRCPGNVTGGVSDGGTGSNKVVTNNIAF